MTLRALFLLLFVMGWAPVRAENRDANGSPGVALSAAQIRDMGVQTTAAIATAVLPQARGLAIVLDPASLAQDIADMKTARSAAHASRQQADRLNALFRDDVTASRQASEAATAQAEADEALRDSLSAKFNLTWGSALAREAVAGKSPLLLNLLDGAAALVRAEFPMLAQSEIPKSVTLTPPGQTDRGIAGAVLSPAPGANQLIEGNGGACLLVLLSMGDALTLRPGLRLTAHAETPGEARAGVLIPRSAIIILDGAQWSYVATAPGRFARKPVEVTGGSQGDQVAVTGLPPGAQVATSGAALLLAAEQRSVLGTGEDE